ncbi:MAG: hydroxyacylglutathione hydrolase [Gaiellaceae bacterium]|jgi:glyoxylase-like metal-dependent hydrolase (beta-lactamase superfamily II)|nr:hydroxyacylglutathione hydrolase [Gaiellaceae bacterium]
MSARVEVVDPGVLRIVLPGRVSNAYLFLGTRIALVDCGSEDSQRDLLAALRQLEIKRERISLVVLTHEHAGHAGGAAAFPEALLVAHSLAAAKLRHGEEPLTKLRVARAPDIELSDGGAIRIGGFSFDVLHMPGHTSGSICLYERSRALIVTGDTVLARGTLSVVTQNGSSGEHLESLERLASLRARLLLPGHGPISDDPAADIAAAATTVRSRLRGWVDQHQTAREGAGI